MKTMHAVDAHVELPLPAPAARRSTRIAMKPTTMTMRISGTKAELSRMASRLRVRYRSLSSGDARQLVALGREALDGGDAAQVVGQLAVEHAHLLAHAA